MINAVQSFGHSFKGLSVYLLHDKDKAPTSERVAWTHCHNLATNDPERAARIMACTAMNQNQIKAAAGGSNRGRKSNAHVLHYVISWHRDEHGEYSKEEMIGAALASMSYIGVTEGEKLGKNKKTGKAIVAKRTQYADEHQAVLVCHDEGPGSNPHVHIMVNRVNQHHGVMVSDSKDFEKLSAWALDYRTAQGKEHLCPERVKNAAKRAQGLLTSHPRKPDNVYRQEQEIAAADPGSRKKALLEQQQRRAKELKTKTVAMKEGQAEAMRDLEDRHVAAERAERAKSAESIKSKTAEIRAAYAPKIDALTQRHTAEVSAFRQAKGTAAGHVRNTWAAFKTKEWMNGLRNDPLNAMRHSFTLAFNSGLQLRDIEKHHGRELGELRGQRTAEERDATRGVRTDEGFKLDDLRQQYHQDRNDLVLAQGMDQAKNNAEWDQLNKDRLAASVDDSRSRDARQDASNDNQHGEDTGGVGKQPSPYARTSVDEQAQASAPPPNPYDIPIDELRQIARELKDLPEPAQEQEQDQEPDQGMNR